MATIAGSLDVVYTAAGMPTFADSIVCLCAQPETVSWMEGRRADLSRAGCGLGVRRRMEFRLRMICQIRWSIAENFEWMDSSWHPAVLPVLTIRSGFSPQ